MIEQRKTRDDWQQERSAHRLRTERWARDRVERSLRGQKHPVYDFLFEYYVFRAAHLQRYSPGLGVLLEEADTRSVDWPQCFTFCPEGAIIEPAGFSIRRLPMVRWCIQLLTVTLERPPVFHCFGLHEWAMVYQSSEVRHGQVPLRLHRDELSRFVESQNLCCTHFDAFRFFTPQAAPRNRIQLNRYSQLEHDQPGCIHANMDLYKWAFTLAPFTSSELIADAFEMAWAAREIDMRASPYDLQHLGFSPIPIETKAGREEYINWQRKLHERSQPIRERLLNTYFDIEQAVTAHLATTGNFSNSTSS